MPPGTTTTSASTAREKKLLNPDEKKDLALLHSLVERDVAAPLSPRIFATTRLAHWLPHAGKTMLPAAATESQG
jgi:hypothetical protein